MRGSNARKRKAYLKKPCHCKLYVWTDGCCLDNGNPGARGGVGVWFNFNHPNNYSGPLPLGPQTNQRAEIYAAIKAIEIAIQEIHARDEEYSEGIIIHTDSKYVVESMTDFIFKWKKNGWRNAKGFSVSNRDLLETLDELIEEVENTGRMVLFQHVPREFNLEADELSRQGAEMVMHTKILIPIQTNAYNILA